MLEKELEKKFVEAVKKAGGKAYKFTSPGSVGVPVSLFVVRENKIGFVELKTEKGKLTAYQKKQLNDLIDKGCCVCLLNNPNLIQPVIELIQRGAPWSFAEQTQVAKHHIIRYGKTKVSDREDALSEGKPWPL